jgi:hypothetical protein
MRTIAVWVAVGLFASTPALGQVSGTSVPFRSANALVAGADGIANIWPGFWGQGPYFGMFPVDGRLLLITPPGVNSCGATPINPSALPAALHERVFQADWVGDSTTLLVLAAKLNSCVVTVFPVVGRAAQHRSDSSSVEWFGDSAATQVMFTVHELFHSYQNGAFQRRAGGIGAFADPKVLSENTELLESPEFQSQLAQEREAMLAAIRASSSSERWSHVRSYHSLRTKRLETLSPRLRSFEDNQERAEGIANWVGYEAVARVVTRRPNDVRLAIEADLASEWFDVSGRPYTGVEKYRRWHLYLVGTAKAWLLEQANPTGWKQRIADGAALEELVVEVMEGAKP